MLYIPLYIAIRLESTSSQSPTTMQPYFSPMTLLNVPLQSQFFCNGNWSPNVNGVLIDVMLVLKKETRWEGDDFPTNVMHLVSHEMFDRCAFRFSEVSLVIRMCFLAVRRRTFHVIISARGTYWNRRENFVYAADSVWVTIMQVRIRS